MNGLYSDITKFQLKITKLKEIKDLLDNLEVNRLQIIPTKINYMV